MNLSGLKTYNLFLTSFLLLAVAFVVNLLLTTKNTSITVFMTGLARNGDFVDCVFCSFVRVHDPNVFSF